LDPKTIKLYSIIESSIKNILRIRFHAFIIVLEIFFLVDYWIFKLWKSDCLMLNLKWENFRGILETRFIKFWTWERLSFQSIHVSKHCKRISHPTNLHTSWTLQEYRKFWAWMTLTYLDMRLERFTLCHGEDFRNDIQFVLSIRSRSRRAYPSLCRVRFPFSSTYLYVILVKF